MRASIPLSLAIIAALVSLGCATNRYATPVGNFRDRTQATIGVLSEFYDSRNDFELQVYLNSVAANPEIRLVGTDAQGTPTPLGKPVFSPAGIKARLDSLDLISVYANRLADLAGSTAPANFKSAGELLGTNLSSLDTTFKTLDGQSDPTASAYVAPIANLIGIVGEMVLEQKRDVLIRQEADKAEPFVNKILDTMKADLDKIFGLAASTGDAQNLAVLVAAYNKDAKSLSFDQRQDRLKQIQAAVKSRSVSAAAIPSSLVTSVAEAHRALLKLAHSPRKPQDFAAFNDVLSAWTTRIQYAATQLKTLML